MIKRTLSAFLACAVLALSLCGCGSEGFSGGERLSDNKKRSDDSATTFNYSDGASEPPSSYNSFANLITGFELKLFRGVFRESDNRDVAFPAACAALTLSQLADGAKGDTRSELNLALGSSLSVEALDQSSSYFQSRLQGVSLAGKTDEEKEAAGKLSLDRWIMLDKTSDARSAFLQTNADFYGSEVLRFDFGAPDSTLKISVETGSEFSCEKSMTVAFKTSVSDKWLSPSASVGAGEFKKAGGTAVRRNYFSSTENYLHTERAAGIIKYTADTPLRLIIAMPDEGVDFADYVRSFDYSEYSDLLDSFEVTSFTEAELPEFSADAGDLRVDGALEGCGLYSLFSDGADFGNISHSELELGAAYSLQNRIAMTAGGISTASAAASADAASSVTKASSSAEKALRFDRPFLWILADNETNIPVLIGTEGMNKE